MVLTSSVPKSAQPHLLAHELTHLDLAGLAKDAGKLKVYGASKANWHTLQNSFESNVVELRWKLYKRYNESQLRNLSVTMMKILHGHLHDVPMDMIVETKIRRRMPALAHAQFIAAKTHMDNKLQHGDEKLARSLTPRGYYKALRNLDGAYALFLDDLFEHTTDYFSQFRDSTDVACAKTLANLFATQFSNLGPGDEYRLVDSFADILGLKDIYTWVPMPPPTSMELFPVHNFSSEQLRSFMSELIDGETSMQVAGVSAAPVPAGGRGWTERSLGSHSKPLTILAQ